MKKHLLCLFLSFLLCSCTVKYSTNIDNNTNTETGDDSDSSNDQQQSPDTQNPSDPTNPDIIAPIEIDSSVLFYPNTLNAASQIITNHSYIYKEKANEYKVYSAYYSEYYDTIYIAYDSTNNHVQTLTAKDLYQIERHALNYFASDDNKTDYKEYLKAVLIYPDTLASSCRNNLQDDIDSLGINGCASYVGKEAVISLNRMVSIENFYVGRHIQYYNIEPMRYTFAHEFGHVSTFYNMAYKNDEDYEDYLKLRLGSYYTSVFPYGLPEFYNSQDSGYYTQPTEILADDYVELFYETSTKAQEDTYDYILNNEYERNSLKNYANCKSLLDNPTLYTQVKQYYVTNFLNNNNKTTYSKPIVISSSASSIKYYESYSKINNSVNIKTIIPTSNINLIAVGEVTVNNIKYYRVILSNTFNVTNQGYDEKQVGKKMGYVQSNGYTQKTNIKIYEINYNRSQQAMMEKTSIAPIQNHSNIYVLPYYDFSYVLNSTNDMNYATTYDYLNPNINGYTYQINIYSFGSPIN